MAVLSDGMVHDGLYVCGISTPPATENTVIQLARSARADGMAEYLGAVPFDRIYATKLPSTVQDERLTYRAERLSNASRRLKEALTGLADSGRPIAISTNGNQPWQLTVGA
jgi:hypothetical protein